MEANRMYADLESNAALFSALLSGITQKEARQKPDAELWSILEVLGYLLDEECLDFRTRLEIALYHPGEIWPPIDPQGWVMAGKYNRLILVEVLAEFLEERGKSLAWLGKIPDPDWGLSYEAPFGRITAGGLLASWAMHDLLHIRQLVELRRARLIGLTGTFSTAYAGDW